MSSPLPGLNRHLAAAEGSPPLVFAIFSEFGPNQIFHLQIKFQGLNIDVI